MHRTIAATIPRPQPGRELLATALLEAPDIDGHPGEFVALEAKPGALSEITTEHAEHDPGWYRLQWYDDAQVSRFSTPVQFVRGEPVRQRRRQ